MEGRAVPEPIWADGGKDDLGTDQKGRTQRQTMALKDVRYRITARIEPRSTHRNELGKLNACFERRARQGKCFQQPYFGCREFPAFFELIDRGQSISPPAAIDQAWGWMLYDVFDLANEAPALDRAPFISVFDATARNGVMEVPPFASDAVRKPRRS